MINRILITIHRVGLISPLFTIMIECSTNSLESRFNSIKYMKKIALLLSFFLFGTPLYVHSLESQKRLMSSERKKRMPVKKQPKKQIQPTNDSFFSRLGAGITNFFAEQAEAKQLSIEQYRELKDACVKNNDKETAIAFIEKMLPLCDDLQELQSLSLQMADLYFDLQSYAKAQVMYQKFVELYPGSTDNERVMYRLCVCNFKQILSTDRDQTKTEQALDQVQQYLACADFKTYREEVTQIAQSCHEKIVESECSIAQFYLTQGKWPSAQKRLQDVRLAKLDKAPTFEPNILVLEAQVADLAQDHLQAAKKRYDLALRFPDHLLSQPFLKQKDEFQALIAQAEKIQQPGTTPEIKMAVTKKPSFTQRF
jgi:outer membrane assembly lipoprotein YfiO